MKTFSIVPQLDRDGKVVITASAVRGFGYSFLSVFLGVYLSLLDFTAFQAGLVFSGIMAGGALSNLVASWKGDVIGRRRMLVAMSVLMVLGGLLFPVSSSVAFLVVIGLFAMTTSTGGDRTAFLSLDTAILVGTCRPSQRTMVFSWYNLVNLVGKALGALLLAVPTLLQSRLGIGELVSYKYMFGVYAATAAVGIALYAMLSPKVEPPKVSRENARSISKEHKSVIARLSGLFFLDALGGGFIVRSFMSYWFVSRFGVDLFSIAGIFFAGQVLNVVSVSLATPMAGRIGLIRTMAFTQVLANLLFIGMAFSTNVWMAVIMFLLHELSNDMDVPTRQSYTMAIVPAESRTSMASVTNLGRNIAQTISPTIAGFAAQATFLGAPFLIGAGIKLIYNGMLYLTFRGTKAPEERDVESTDRITGQSEKASA